MTDENVPTEKPTDSKISRRLMLVNWADGRPASVQCAKCEKQEIVTALKMERQRSASGLLSQPFVTEWMLPPSWTKIVITECDPTMGERPKATIFVCPNCVVSVG